MTGCDGFRDPPPSQGCFATRSVGGSDSFVRLKMSHFDRLEQRRYRIKFKEIFEMSSGHSASTSFWQDVNLIGISVVPKGGKDDIASENLKLNSRVEFAV